MIITGKILADRLQQAETARDEALRAAQHYEGRAAELRQLTAILNESEQENTNEAQTTQ